jgi:hypothetical protein
MFEQSAKFQVKKKSSKVVVLMLFVVVVVVVGFTKVSHKKRHRSSHQ